MEQTTNYQLSQWDEKDRILREDFNADNAKVEQALAEVAEQAAMVSKCGNCKIVYGSYTGNGKYGSGNKNTLSFNHKPIMVFVQNPSVSNADEKLRMMRGIPWASSRDDSYFEPCTVSWSNSGVEWYGDAQSVQFNISGTVYNYMALLAADE